MTVSANHWSAPLAEMPLYAAPELLLPLPRNMHRLRRHSCSLLHESESSHREGAHALDLDRHGKKTEALARKLVRASKVFNDGDFLGKQDRMHGPSQVRYRQC